MSTAISPTIDRDAWLKARSDGIGASEAAAAIGLPEAYETPLQLYARKVAPGENKPASSFRMTMGLMMEPIISRLYEEETCNKILKVQKFIRSEAAPHLFATLDGIDDTGQIVEFKTINESYAARVLGEPETDEVPFAWIIQAHQQMFCRNPGIADGAESVTFAVLVGLDRFTFYDVPWSSRLWFGVKERLDAFWDRVQRRDPPPATKPEDVRALTRLYPSATGSIELSEADATLADEWQRLGAEASEINKRRDAIKLRLLEIMQDRELATLPDGRRLRRSVSMVQEHTVKAFLQTRLTINKGR